MSTFVLGFRLALRADRVRLVVTAGAVAVTVAFLLGVLGALPAREAKLARLDARNTVSVGSQAEQGLSATGLRLESRATYWRGERIEVRRVQLDGDAPLAPGLPRYPGPGEIIASPRLAEVLAGPRAAELATRFPDRVVGTIGDEGLAGPDELYAYVGTTDLDSALQPIARFGSARDKVVTPPELRVAAMLGAVGLLLPVLVLVATATRLSAASRDRRLSALRLVGATPKQAAGVAGADGLVAGILGVVGGLGLFLLVRPIAASLLPYSEGVYAGDLAPHLSGLLLVVVAVPLLAVVTSVLALRRVVTSPLGVRRDARVRTAGWWRLVPVLVGLGLLVAFRQRAQGPTHHVTVPLLLIGGALTLVGLAVAAPAVSRLTARLLGRLPGLSSTLAARRVEADPSASARVVTGMVLVVFVAAWLLAFLPVLRASSGVSQDAGPFPRGTLTSYSDGPRVDVAPLRAISGVRAAAQLSLARVTPPGWTADDGVGPFSGQVLVASCQDVASLVGGALACDGALLHRLAGPDGSGYRSELPEGVPLTLRSDDDAALGTLTFPLGGPVLVVPALASGLLGADLVVDPSLVPPSATSTSSRLVVATDGSADVVEAVRAALPYQAAVNARTLEEEVASSASVYLGYVRAVKIGLVLALLIAAASLAVSTADAVHERRRSLAALLALGTPLKVLRRTTLLQMAAPMVGNVVFAVGAAAVASACYLSAYEEAWSLPWAGWAWTALGGLGAVVLATGATLPLLRSVARPDALRTE